MTETTPKSRLVKMAAIVIAAFLAAALSGCGNVTAHRVMSAVFNKVPVMPQSDEFCDEFIKNQQALAAAAKASASGERTESVHPPYEEKRCNNCHTEEKDLGGGLVLPREKLCFKCHPDILKYKNRHGPASEGDCLACHLPHSSPDGPLLVEPRDKICLRCHTERRQAYEMHSRVGQFGMTCADCHDPHSGEGKFFVK